MRYSLKEAELAVGLIAQQDDTSAGFFGVETSIGRHVIGNDGRPVPTGVVALPDHGAAVAWLIERPTCDELRDALDSYDELEANLDVDGALGAADRIISLVRVMLVVDDV